MVEVEGSFNQHSSSRKLWSNRNCKRHVGITYPPSLLLVVSLWQHGVSTDLSILSLNASNGECMELHAG